MKLNHKEITIQQYISEAIENDVVMYQKEQKTVLVVNDTAYAIWNAITNAAEEKRDITTEEIATSLCAQTLWEMTSSRKSAKMSMARSVHFLTHHF